MSKHRAIPFTAFAAVALLVLAPSAATAQSGISDVIRAGRVNGVELPAEVVAWMESQGEDAFEFERVWKRRVEVVRANRAAFDAAERQRPSRGAMNRVTTQELQAAGAVLDGTFRMPILLGRPSDATTAHTPAAYAARMFGAGSATVYSLTSFYDEMSQGTFDFTGSVIGWVSLPNTAVQYYGSGNTNIFGETYTFIAHTVAGADATVDFGLYDNDGPDGVPNSGDDDGFVDLAAFMFPAAGRECGGSSPGIWAHRYTTAGWTGTYVSTNDASAEGGVIRVADYIIQGGYDCDGTSLQQIGVVAHEAGHGFGLPDLYDTDACPGTPCEDGVIGEGVGHWDLMGSGNWNEPASPAHMSAHSKAFLGWVDIVTVLADTSLTIAPIFDVNTAYRVNTTIPGQYFLLENRQQLGSDAHLANTGLLIWHVDSTVYEGRRNSNSVNSIAAAKGLDLEEADGQAHLDISYLDAASNRGDGGDPWPGTSNRTTFNATSTPSSHSNGGSATNIAFTNIVETAGGDITLVINIPDLVTYGDVNDDMAVTAADLDVVAAFVIGETGPDYTHIGLADVDADGDTDARDVFIIHAYLDGTNTDAFRVGDVALE